MNIVGDRVRTDQHTDLILFTTLHWAFLFLDPSRPGFFYHQILCMQDKQWTPEITLTIKRHVLQNYIDRSIILKCFMELHEAVSEKNYGKF